MNGRVLATIRKSGGRFFGLYTKQGESLNAQLVSESPCYMTVFDRNSGVTRTFAKSSVAGVTLGGMSIGRTTV